MKRVLAVIGSIGLWMAAGTTVPATASTVVIAQDKAEPSADAKDSPASAQSEKAASSVVPDKDASEPAVDEDASESAVDEDASEPAVDEDTSESAAGEDTSEPAADEDTSESASGEDTSQPATSKEAAADDSPKKEAAELAEAGAAEDAAKSAPEDELAQRTVGLEELELPETQGDAFSLFGPGYSCVLAEGVVAYPYEFEGVEADIIAPAFACGADNGEDPSVIYNSFHDIVCIKPGIYYVDDLEEASYISSTYKCYRTADWKAPYDAFEHVSDGHRPKLTPADVPHFDDNGSEVDSEDYQCILVGNENTFIGFAGRNVLEYDNPLVTGPDFICAGKGGAKPRVVATEWNMCVLHGSLDMRGWLPRYVESKDYKCFSSTSMPPVKPGDDDNDDNDNGGDHGDNGGDHGDDGGDHGDNTDDDTKTTKPDPGTETPGSDETTPAGGGSHSDSGNSGNSSAGKDQTRGGQLARTGSNIVWYAVGGIALLGVGALILVSRMRGTKDNTTPPAGQ